MSYKNYLTLPFLLSTSLSSFTLADSISESNHEQIHTKAAPVYWYDGHRKQVLWQATDEFVIHATVNNASKDGKALKTSFPTLPPEAEIIEANKAWARVRIPATTLKKDHQSSNVKTQQLSNVYYESKSAATTPVISTKQIIVHFNQIDNRATASKWGKKYNLSLTQSLHLDRAFLYQCNISDDCLENANNAYLDKETIFAYPNWLKPLPTRSLNDHSANDPLLNNLWHLDNTGQNNGLAHEDANVMNAWNTGHGSSNEVIAIIDNGMDIYHEDLAANIIPGLSQDFVDKDNNPAGGRHGTNAAGVAAARGGNGIGISGVAPHAGLVGIRLLGARTQINEAAALTLHKNKIDIYSNSWGPADIARLDGPSPLSKAALVDGIRQGRNGKGSIYVWAAGNGYRNKDNANYDGYANSPYTIAVAASTNTGSHAWYSEKGANLWVNAPSSGGTLKITTTNNSAGQVASPDNYRDSFGGTSAAAPLVAGVVALMLEQNPELSWRDVQHILAKTAYQNDATDSEWLTNGAGHWVSHKYGFGRVDAAAASLAAKNWKPLPPATTITRTSNPELFIPDNNEQGITPSINIENDLAIDYVEISFQSDHTRWGDLEISLISPAGTPSVLAESSARNGAAYQDSWVFGVARLLGESSQGNWTLQVKDKTNDHNGYLQNWSIKIYGSVHTQATPIPPSSIPLETTANISVNHVSIDQDWKTIQLNSAYTAPVIIAGPPSFNGQQPATIRLRNTDTNSFEIRIQEWDYLDAYHKTESVPYLVLESGHHILSEDTQWEAGTYTQGDTGKWQTSSFKQDFATPPLVFLTMQTAHGGQTAIVRAKNITRSGFESAIFEQEAFMNGHKMETIGYLAISSDTSTTIIANGQSTSYQLKTMQVSHEWSPVNATTMIKVEEETSADPEIRHLNETLTVLQVQNQLFAQDISSLGSNTAALRIKTIID